MLCKDIFFLQSAESLASCCNLFLFFFWTTVSCVSQKIIEVKEMIFIIYTSRQQIMLCTITVQMFIVLSLPISEAAEIHVYMYCTCKWQILQVRLKSTIKVATYTFNFSRNLYIYSLAVAARPQYIFCLLACHRR